MLDCGVTRIKQSSWNGLSNFYFEHSGRIMKIHQSGALHWWRNEPYANHIPVVMRATLQPTQAICLMIETSHWRVHSLRWLKCLKFVPQPYLFCAFSPALSDTILSFIYNYISNYLHPYLPFTDIENVHYMYKNCYLFHQLALIYCYLQIYKRCWKQAL